MRLLAITLVLFSVIGCAKKGASTANFRLVMAGLTTQQIENFAQGGMMLWGSNASGAKAFANNIDTASAEFSIEVDNTSDWKFVAIMWDGDIDYDEATAVVTAYPFYGIPRCAVTTVTASELQSGDVNLSLALSNSSCNDTATFGHIVEELTPSQIYRFASVATNSCRQSALASVSDANALCDFEATGLASSASISLALIEEGEPGFNPQMKECYSFYDAPIVTSRANIPTNVSSFPRVYRQYVGTQSCNDSDTRGFQSLVIDSAASSFYKSFQDSSVDPYPYRVYLALDESSLCSGNRNSTVYATGSADSYWVGICTRGQWNYVANDSATFYNRNLILLNDLNFYGNFDPSVDQSPSPETFVPFGGTDLSIAGNQFEAIFEGNFKKIIGPEFEFSGGVAANDLGLFRRIGTSGVVRNFRLVFPMFELKEDNPTHAGVGAVAGYNEGTIQAVKVVEGELEGFADVGGLVGVNFGSISASSFSGYISGLRALGGVTGRHSGAASLSQVAASEVHVRSERIGVCSNPTFQNSADCVGATETWHESTDLGGVVGVIESCAATTDFSEVAGRAVISGGTKIGGFVGRIADSVAGCDLADILVRPVLTATEPIGDVGGIFGYLGNSVTVTVDRLVMPEIYLHGANAYLDIGNAPSPASFVTYNSLSSKIYDASGRYVFNSIDSATKPAVTTATQRYQVTTYSSAGYDINTATATQMWFMPAAGHAAPRFSFEGGDECDGKYGANIVAGDGAATTPYLICNAAQLKNFQNVGDVTAHYKVMKNLDFAHEGVMQAALNTNAFQGKLNGNFKWLTGLSLGGGGEPTSKNGLFREVAANASVNNLNIVVDVDYSNSGATAALTGGLAGINHGSLIGVNVLGKIKFLDTQAISGSVGGIVGSNNGVIAGSESRVNIEAGVNSVGGIAGSNSGAIVYSGTYARINLVKNSLTNIGGVVGSVNAPATPTVNFYDPIAGVEKLAAGTIDNIYNGAKISARNAVGEFSGGHSNVGGIVGQMQDGSITNVDNRAYIDLRALVFESLWTPAGGPLTCDPGDYKYSRSTGPGSQHTITWVEDDIALCVNGIVLKLPCTPEADPPSAESSGVSAYVPLCNFGTIAGKTIYATAVIEKNMSQASVSFNSGVDENRIIAHTSVGKWIGSLGSGTFVNNGLINMPRFRSFNQSERTLNPTTLTSSNMNLQWGVSNYHEVFPLTPAGGSGTTVSLYTTPPAGIIFNDDYLWAYGQGPYVMNPISGSSITASAPPLPGLPYQSDLFYYSAPSEISSLSYLMGNDYGFDVSLEAEDANTSWFVSDDEMSYWNNYYAYEDIIYNGQSIEIYLKAIQ